MALDKRAWLCQKGHGAQEKGHGAAPCYFASDLTLPIVICLYVRGCVRPVRKKWLSPFLAGLQSNSGLWIDVVRPSVCLSVRLSVCLSVRPSVCLSTFWLTCVFKFVLGHINQYRLDTLHGNGPWWDLLNCDLSLWPWPSLFLFKVT